MRPIEWGADIVVHSATKYLGGHGTSIAGAIVDSGNFDFASQPERFPLYNTPDESYHGLVYARDLGVGGALGANLAFLLRIQTLINRDLGAVTSPFNAFLISQGIETLSLRIERHIENATKVARWLEANPLVDRVIWPAWNPPPGTSVPRSTCQGPRRGARLHPQGCNPGADPQLRGRTEAALQRGEHR